MKKRLWILFLVLCFMLSGCSSRLASDTDSEYALPTPVAEETQDILGEVIEYDPVSVTFNYISGDGTSFSTIKRFMTPASNENFCETILNTMLSSTSTTSQMSFLPAGTKISSLEFSCGIATINLSADALNVQDETDTLKLMACLSNTLLSVPDVKAVNILISGRSVAVADLPVGVRTQMYSGITPVYAQMNTEKGYFLEQITGTIQRNAVLYFPSANGDWIIPETRSIEFNSTDYSSALIRALRNGSDTLTGAIAPLPKETDLLINNPVTENSSTGERVLVLDFSSELRNYCNSADLPEWKALASIVLTATSFVPNIDAVKIMLDGEALTGCTVDGKSLNFTDGLIHRSDFTNYIGGAFTAYLPCEDGSLQKTEGSLSMRQSVSPRAILEALFALSENSGTDSAFPKNITAGDILGVSLSNGICTVNLSANYYREALKFTASQERACVYSIVNTLCAQSEIRGVRILIEGRSVESFTGEVFLQTILLSSEPTQTESNSEPEQQ